ncbi:MAG: YdcF family protein [Bryobacteraceae bacterium]
MSFRGSRALFLVGLLAGCLALSHSIWLSALGKWLIREDSPDRSDAVVVLAGDFYGHRVLKAAELVRQGLAPRVLVSGPPGFYGVNEGDLAIRFAVQHGFPESQFVKVSHGGLSTLEEARAMIETLRRERIASILLVTSDYHTRRAGRIYERLAPDLRLRVIPTPDEFFRWNGWWRTRQAQKIFYMEWSKTFANWLGI